MLYEVIPYPSIYSLWHQRALGKTVGATPDGRNAGEQLSESQSPTYNTERKGPTAVLNSVAKLPLKKTPTGGLNIKFQPSLFKNEGGKSVLVSLISGFFKNGGMHMQINVIDKDELIDAQKHPEKHMDLLVRVVGYSAYFVTLSPEQQNEIIERTMLSVITSYSIHYTKLYEVIFISHRLDEIFEIADKITILKDGLLVGEYDTKALDKLKLVSLMIGNEKSAAL